MNDLIHVKGLSELGRVFDQLPDKLSRNVLRGGLRAAAKVIASDAKATTAFHDKTGRLRKSIRVTTRFRRGQLMARVVAGGGRAFYAHIVEGGAQPHVIEAKGRLSARAINRAIRRGSIRIGQAWVGASVMHPGVEPRRFMKSALERSAQRAIVAARDYMRERLSKKHGIDVPGPTGEGE